MIDISSLRHENHVVISLGIHPGIIQSMLDYEYMIGKKAPSVRAIILSGRKQHRFFWGEEEVIVPIYPSLDSLPQSLKETATLTLNVLSGRRVLEGVTAAVKHLPSLQCMTIFAEQVPERHALVISRVASKNTLFIIGPASVGLLLPGFVKLGAIGGTMAKQIEGARIVGQGDVAVVSTSGGMVNELMHMVTGSGNAISFALALGGDRFPILTPAEAMMLAERDTSTKAVVFFGELGGQDEYEIAQLMRQKKLTKKVYAYIAGEVSSLFETPPQFGHAKAMASTQDESAAAKKKALREVGAKVAESLADMQKALQARGSKEAKIIPVTRTIKARQKAIISSQLTGDKSGRLELLGKDFLSVVDKSSFESLVLSMFLGRMVESEKLAEFTKYVFRLLVDNGPYVSGAVNTIVAARAGKDLVSSLASGLLTIGPRFGGAVNAAGQGWFDGVNNNMTPKEFVQSFKGSGGIISGIGHKKYRIDLPDPRVEKLLEFSGSSNGDRYLQFALEVQKITTAKKGNLILNVDGCIAAIMLDLLESELKYDEKEIQSLIDVEFFNALFVLSRSVGFMAHYMDQRRNDEGLLRFGDEHVRYIS